MKAPFNFSQNVYISQHMNILRNRKWFWEDFKWHFFTFVKFLISFVRTFVQKSSLRNNCYSLRTIWIGFDMGYLISLNSQVFKKHNTYHYPSFFPLSTFSPLSPLSPGIPLIPGIPGLPGIPGNPDCPCLPGIPGIPFKIMMFIYKSN